MWDLNPEVPGEVVYGYYDPKTERRCGFLGFKKCYDFVVERKMLTDPQAWRDFISNETVLMARPRIGSQ